MEKKYGPAEVEKKTGIPTTRLHFYVKEGLIKIGNPGRGRGRKFSRKNIFESIIVDAFRTNGAELSTIKRIFQQKEFKRAFDFSTYEVDNPTGVFLVAWDNGEKVGVKLRRDPETMKRTDTANIDLSEYPGAVVINLSWLYDRLKLI